MVDTSINTRIYPAFLVTSEDGNNSGSKKAVFQFTQAKGQMKAIDEGDLSPENVREIASRLDVPEHEVVSMNEGSQGQTTPLTRRGRRNRMENGKTGWLMSRRTKNKFMQIDKN